MTDSIVRDYLESYQFVHDDGSSRALTDDERALLEDFGDGLLAWVMADGMASIETEAAGLQLLADLKADQEASQ